MTRPKDYVKIAEAADILGVSQGTVRARAEAGKIPMHRNPANGYRPFRRENLDELLCKTARSVRPSPRRQPR